MVEDQSQVEGHQDERQRLFRERLLYLQPTGPDPLRHRDDFGGPASCQGSFEFPFPSSFTSTFLVQGAGIGLRI